MSIQFTQLIAMIQLHFTCTLHSDLVLSSSASTEGFYQSLDYIPGNKFLGLVAKAYDLNNAAQTLDLFHNGSVRFGDAHPVGEDLAYSYKVPKVWLLPKGEKLDVPHYQYQHLTDDLKKQLSENGVQLKQVKSGYFTEAGSWLSIDQRFSIKSAYDRKKYRAKDQQMYGYYALKKGSTWRFKVDLEDEKYVSLIKNQLVGIKFIGRSSSAEYGKIEIEEIPSTAQKEILNIDSGEAYLYAVSNLCFYDALGQNTLQPDPILNLNLPEGSKIKWEKSSITYRPYITWNRHRNNRNPDRMIIEKGSVFTVSLASPIRSDRFLKGIGSHRSEGFGQILINPAFLDENDPATQPLQKIEVKNAKKGWYPVKKGVQDEQLIQYLNGQLGARNRLKDIDQIVNDFMVEHLPSFSLVTASQWGNVRNIARNVNTGKQLNDLLFDTKFGYFYTGQSEKYWRSVRVDLEKFLKHFSEGIDPQSLPHFVEKLSTEMAKAAKN